LLTDPLAHKTLCLSSTPSASAAPGVFYQALVTDDLLTVYQVLAQYPNLLDRRDAHGLTPLAITIINGRTDIALYLIAQGANLQLTVPCTCFPEETGFTALHLAVCQGNESLVRFLLDKGMDVNAFTMSSHYTPLHLACLPLNEAGKVQATIVEMLLQRGAHVNAQLRYPLKTTITKESVTTQQMPGLGTPLMYASL
jgi:ankyrin repeat protein